MKIICIDNIRNHLMKAPILAAVLVLFVFIGTGQTVYAEEYTSEDQMTFYYIINGPENDRYAAITDCDGNTVPADGTVVIPDVIDGYPVREIWSKALYNAVKMQKAVVPDSVRVIDRRAFYLCENLSEISFGENVEIIGEQAFYQTGLQTVTFPKSLKSIGAEAFGCCSRLKSVTVSESVSEIDESAFMNCLTMESFYAEPGSPYFKSIDGVLYTADGKSLIKYPVAHMTGDAKSEEYAVADGTERISDYAFQYADSLKSIKMADTVQSIGKSAFEYCTALTEVTLPSALTTVGERAFDGCAYITIINIPKGLAELPSSAFAGCARIAAYNVEEGSEHYASDNGVLYDAGYKTLLKYPAAKQDEEYSAASGTKTISDYGFQKADKLRKVVLPDGVTIIGDFAFSECYGLEEINLPDSVKTIGDYAFLHCSYLRSVEIPAYLTGLGKGAFNISGIEEAIVPGTVETIGELAFSWCNNLRRVVLNRGTKSIGNEAFSYCPSLAEITMPMTVETIGDGLLDGSGTALDGEPIKFIGYIQTAGEVFYRQNAEKYNLVFERAVKPINQKISVTGTRNCTYGSKAFAIGAKARTVMTYESSNTKVATISDKGIVTLKGIGKAVITVKAGEDNYYNAAEAKVTINVKPGKPSLQAKNIKSRKIKIVWSKVSKASGYEVYIKAPGQKKYYKRATKDAKVKSITHSGLKKGKYYYYKVRAFTKVNGKKVYGAFSKVRKVKVRQ